MSYNTVMSVADGIIMAADRRSCHFVEKVDGIIYSTAQSNTVKKLFLIGDNIGIGTGGYTAPMLDIHLEHLSRDATFKNPMEAAQNILDYFNINEKNKKNPVEIFVTGYDKSKQYEKSKYFPGTTNYLNPIPETYYINTAENEISLWQNYGFVYRGCNSHFDTYKDKINSIIKKSNNYYTLQDAVDVSKFAFDISRKIDRYFYFVDNMSIDMDMIVITPYEAKWLIKRELEA